MLGFYNGKFEVGFILYFRLDITKKYDEKHDSDTAAGCICHGRPSREPLPPSHPYSFLNPLIDPWWAKLDKETQT